MAANANRSTRTARLILNPRRVLSELDQLEVEIICNSKRGALRRIRSMRKAARHCIPPRSQRMAELEREVARHAR